MASELLARKVYLDCEYALSSFDDSLESSNLQDWRVKWYATMALLRTIDFVLMDVDSREHAPVAKVLGANWHTNWKRENIFTYFIRQDRNDIIHEYIYNIKLEEAVIITESGELRIAEDGQVRVTSDFLRIKQGHFVGRDGRQLIREALDWWDRVLSVIEAEF